MMAAIIFISFLAIFEPISIFFVIKIIDWWKHFRQTHHTVKLQDFGTAFILGLSAAFLTVPIIIGISQNLLPAINPGVNNIGNYVSNFGPLSNPTLNIEMATEITTFIGAIETIIVVFVLAIGLVILLRYFQSPLSSVLLFFGGAILVTIIAGLIISNYIPLEFGLGGETFWLTTTPATTSVFGDPIYTMRLMFFQINFGNPPNLNQIVLLVISTPFTFVQYGVNFTWIGLAIYYVGRKFTTRSVSDGELVHRTTFAQIFNVPPLNLLQEQPSTFLCTLQVGAPVPEANEERGKAFLDALEKGITVQEIMTQFNLDAPAIRKRLTPLFRGKLLALWQAEYSYTFQEARVKGVNIIYSDGRDVFSTQFEESTVDPALVAGMFSAITSFIKETTKSTDLLRSIDHGDTSVIIEYGKYVFGAVFANRETLDVRAKLRDFIDAFEERHASILVKWNGNVEPFNDDEDLMKKTFS